MMIKPLISLVIPTHIRSVLLKRALTSINIQSLRNDIEIIVISDIKDHQTDLVCNKLLSSQDVYIIRNGVPGPAESRNLGIKLAKGQYIMFLDDDDAWAPLFTNELQEKIKNLNGVITYFNCTVFKESRTMSGPIVHSSQPLDWSNKVNDNIYVKNQVHMSSVLFPTHIVKGLFFDSTMRAYEDWEFILATLKHSHIYHLPLMCSYIYEVDDDTTDRRGSSEAALNFNAVLDYLYVYRRHPSPSLEISKLRQNLLHEVGLYLDVSLL